MTVTTGWTHAVADYLGGSEPALRLMLGQFSGYPLLILVYRRYVANKDEKVQHLFFLLTGLLVGYWVVGAGVGHSITTILVTYIILLIAGGTLLSVVLSFSFNLVYLLVGYWYKQQEDDSYDISWTMPQCVLCLRLIGLTINIYDGKVARTNPALLSQDQKKDALSGSPSLLEMLSFCFFIGGYFVGPQFPMRKYKEFITPTYQQSLPESPVSFGLQRLGCGFCYLIGHVVVNRYFPEEWPTTTEYAESHLCWKLLGLIIWAKVILAKYLSAWLFSEGVCAVSGLSYVGKYEDGRANWTGCANVKLRRLESASQFGHYIMAFNINTNGWVASYIYKRLRFLNNRMISQVVTLVFLAVWHGWHVGYYLTFFNEFVVMAFEQDFSRLWAGSPRVKLWRNHPAYPTMTAVLGWLYCHFMLPHCFMPFPLLTGAKIWAAYQSVYFVHFIFYLGWFPIWRKLTLLFLGRERDHQN